MSIDPFDLDDADLVDQESVPVRERIIDALQIEPATNAEGVGELPGRPGPYELPAPVLEAVEGLCGDPGLPGQPADTEPVGAP